MRDWMSIENEFVTDTGNKPCTIKSLAEKHHISYSLMRTYAAKHNWTEKRDNHRANILQKTANKVADIASDDAAAALVKHFELSCTLMSVIEKGLQDLDKFFSAGQLDDSKLLNVVNAFEKLQKLQRQTLGIMDRRDEERIRLEQQKLSPDEEDETADDGFMDAMKRTAVEVWNNRQSDEE